MSAVGDRLRAKRNIDPDQVDETELQLIDDEIAGTEATFISVADRHPTRDSVPLIKFMRLATEYIAENTSPAWAKAQLRRFENGEIAFIQLNSNTEELEAQLAEANRKREEAERNLELMQATAKGTGPKGLSAGSATDTIMTEIQQYVEKDPDRAKSVFDLLQSLSALDGADYKARAELMRHIVDGKAGWNLVPSPPKGEMLPAILVSATQKVAKLEDDLNVLNSGSVAHKLVVAEKALNDERDPAKADSLAGKLKVAEDQLNPNIKDSIGYKAKWFDFNMDSANDGWVRRLEQVTQQLKDERDPTKKDSLTYKLIDVTQQLDDERDDTVAGSLAQELATAEQKLHDAQNVAVDGSLANRLANVTKELDNERDAAMAGSLADQLQKAQADLAKAKKGEEDATKVLTPISEAIAHADKALDGALEKLADKHWGINKFVPKRVKQARNEIGVARENLRKAQNPKP